MVRRLRLDSELVRRGLARSREQAAAAIERGRVQVAGRPATKASTVVDLTTPIVVDTGDDPGYASRGAYKLLAAIEAFGPPTAEPFAVAGRACLDAGASTGGFTDVLLRHGAASVVAVDVGYGQLAWRLRNDPRVTVLDRTNVRHLTRDQVGDGITVVVADVSFISLPVVLPALRSCAEPHADFVVLVKPQFEVGRDRLGAGGVVRDPTLHAEAVAGVAAAGAGLGLGVRGVVASPLPGPAGNVEYLLWLSDAGGVLEPGTLAEAIAAGPAGPATRNPPGGATGRTAAGAAGNGAAGNGAAGNDAAGNDAAGNNAAGNRAGAGIPAGEAAGNAAGRAAGNPEDPGDPGDNPAGDPHGKPAGNAERAGRSSRENQA